MLEITDLSYRYQSRGSFTLQRINLKLGAGEMLLLAGRSGCGKSTLIKAVTGLLGSDGAGELQGNIFLNGEDVTYWPPERIGRLVGTVYQSPDDQLFAMTVADEVGFALENQGQEPEEIKRQVSQTLKLVGLEGFENYSIHKLSGGQRQRLALASILITKPRLLILDEPVSQMNPQGVQSFMQLLVRLNREEGIAILMIEHRVNELCRYFQRLAVMQEGRIIYDGAIDAAWYALTGLNDVGVREPQSVKLCRALQLPRLTVAAASIAEMIRQSCAVEHSVQVPKRSLEKAPVVLQAQEVYYTYPGAAEPTLHGLSFALHKGEIVALMGFNGAGKSTLLNLLGGLTATRRGSVTLNKQPIKKALGQVGYLRQEPDLMLLADTVREELCWKNTALPPAKVEDMLQRLNLLQYADDFPLALSKGQRLRVVLGAMLAKSPALLLLDEPTTGQDEQSLGEIKRLLSDYKNNGGCVLLCTHDVELAAEVADRVLVLRQGRIIADAGASAVLSDEQLLEEGGLTPSPLLDICRRLRLPLCVTIKEVLRYVGKTAVGRH